MKKTTNVTCALLLFVSMLSLPVLAQTNETASTAKSSSSKMIAPHEETSISQNEPLTLKDRFDDYRQTTFQPMVLVFPAIAAGYNQMNNYPSEWNQGGEGYAKRLASATGGVVLGNTISFGVAAVSHEDPRYVRSTYPKKAVFRRAGYAIAHTFVSRVSSSDREGHTFAWSRMVGAYGSGFIANEWFPERRSTLHNAVYLSTFNLAADLGSNILREFIRPHWVWGSGKANKTKP